MKKSITVLLSALILGICIIIAAHNLNPNKPNVSVRGLCEREVMADRAIYPISYKESGDDLSELFKSVKAKNEIICQFLKEHGFSDEEIFIGSPKMVDRMADSYASNYRSRYTVNSTVNLCTSKVEDVIKVQSDLTALLEQGIAVTGSDWENPITYEFTSLNSIKPEMIQEANNNAREAAEQFAKDSHSRVGRIQNASQGLFSIEQRDANTPYIKKVRVVTYVTYTLR